MKSPPPSQLEVPKLKNLTHLAKLHKQNPNNPLIKSIERAQAAIDNYQEALTADPTKTQQQKRKLLYEATSKQIMNLLPSIDRYRNSITEKIAGYKSRVDGVMEVKGTTDFLILSNMATAISDLGNMEIFELGKTEPDALRSVLLLPTERYKRKLNDNSDSESYLKEALVEVTLGKADYQTYQELQDQEGHANILGQALVEVTASSSAKAAAIDLKVAAEPEVYTEP